MSDPHYPAAPAKARPGSVTAASYLLFLVAALQVAGLVIGVFALGPTIDAYEAALAGTPLEGQAGVVGGFGLIVGIVVGALLAVAFVVLGVLDNRGKNPARIVTWVLGGLTLCCVGVSFGMSSLNSTMLGSGGGNVPDQAEVQRMLESRLPSWYGPASTTVSVLAAVALLVALILLALPASNEFFRKAPTVWEPPVPGSTYPAYPPPAASPGYPQAVPPGYPQAAPPGYPPPASPPGYPPPASPPGYPPPASPTGQPPAGPPTQPPSPGS